MRNTPDRNRWRLALPRGLLGMLVLVTMIERLLAHDDLHFSTGVALSWRYTDRMVRTRARRCDILCFGDSMVKFGLVPKVIKRQTGRSAYNLALYAGPPPASYFLLRRALEHGARPKAVVVNFSPHLLALDPWYHVRNWPELATLRESVDLAWNARDASFLGSTLLAQALPSVRDRFEIRANIKVAFQGISYSSVLHGEFLPLWRNWNLNSGAQVATANPEFHGETLPADTFMYPDKWSCKRLNALYVRRFFELAEAHHVRIFWLLPPNAPETQARREQLGLDEQWSRYVRAVQSRFPNLVVLDARRSGYETSVFMDPVHLVRRGSCALSADVGAALRDQLSETAARPRWIKLPHYHETPSDPSIEEVLQSKIAVRNCLPPLR